MADSKQPSKAILNRPGSYKPGDFPHLRPLSVYSRPITCDTPSVGMDDPLRSPFCNLQVKIFNNCSASEGRKRQLDDSCLDETYETPQKKPYLSECHSPDLACVLDSPLLEEKNGAPECSVVEEKVNKVANRNINNSTDTENTAQHKLPCLDLTGSINESDGRSSPLPSFNDIQSSSPLIHNSENIGHLSHAFVFIEDEIMCLSPIECNASQPDSDGQQPQGKAEGQEGVRNTGSENDEGYFTKSFKTAELKESDNVIPSDIVTPVMSTPLDKFRQLVKRSPILKRLKKLGESFPALNQELENASSSLSLYGSMNLDGMNDEIFTQINENIDSKFRSVNTAIQKSLVCHKEMQVQVVTDTVKQVTEAKIDTDTVKQVKEAKIVAATVKQENEAKVVPPLRTVVVTETVKQVKEAKVVPPLRTVVVTETVKQVKEAKVVPPLRAAVVADTVKQVKEAKIVTVKQVKEAKVVADTVKQAKDVPPVGQQVNPKFKVTFREEVCPSTSLESAAPLQVMSKVVAFSIQRQDEKAKSAVKPPAAALASVFNTSTESQELDRKSQYDNIQTVPGEVQRPVVFNREEDWERGKKVYVDSVVRHMQENRGDGNGVMNELFHLMDTVASQGNQRQGKQWQHPSDLTRRNYQSRNRDSTMSLDEWQNRNYRYLYRFSGVPRKFRRSPLP
ncbi:S100P-binding protein [Astyanax mexicanus]|uniref:S100P-binding protein n=1 Tax=Astyanax mexicanus TaxID=7994 RepID=A0A8T2LZF2_ASTMX|nr:S100P-binding protein [Astyanax mexicanus]